MENKDMQAQERTEQRELAEILTTSPEIADELLLYAKGYLDGIKSSKTKQSA